MAEAENKIQSATLKKLQKAGIFCWRNNNNAVWDSHLNNGFGAYRSFGGLKGVPDIIAIVKGQFVGIEVKTPKGKLSPEQVLFKKRCVRNGGKYLVVKHVDDVDILLK